jgi:GntR family transcriptional regulator/MocR family aminotransferase
LPAARAPERGGRSPGREPERAAKSAARVGITLDARRKLPLHRQIFDEVVARIEARAFPPGYKLPATRVLAQQLSTHRNTVARAYAELEAAGFVSSGVGRGTFVQSAPPVASSAAGVERRHERAALPWSALLSRAARTEAIERAVHRAPTEHKSAINLAHTQPSADLIPDELLRRCIAHALSGHALSTLSYAPPEGTLRLREQIAKDLVARGVPARAEEVIVTSGSQQGLDLVARALLNPGDTLLVEPTTYSGALELFTLAGARLVSVPMDASGPDPAVLERAYRPEVKALYLMPNAHNPTGRTMPAERRRALVAWSRASGVPIIEDDYAAGLALEPESEPLPHLRALDGEIIHVSTFSKRLAPALRMGYVVAPAALRPVLTSTKRVVDLGASLVLQQALAEFIERGYLRAHASRVREVYRARRDALDAALRKALPPGVRWEKPSHGLVLWLTLPPGLDDERVAEEAERAGVLVGPGNLWSVGGRAPAALRLSFSAEPEPRLSEAARRLGKVLKQMLAQRKHAEPAHADRGGEGLLEVI